MQDLSLLRILDEPNEYLSAVWALMRPSSPKLPSFSELPQSLNENNGKGKGSQFAKFIAERKEAFDGPFQLGKSKVPSDEIFRSKL